MQLDTAEVQVAIAEYLRKRGVVIDDVKQVRLEIVSMAGERLNMGNCMPIVTAYGVTLPTEPYR